MVREDVISVPPASVTSFLLKIAVYEDKLLVLDRIFAEEESVNCLMEDEMALFEQMKILSEGIRRGERQFSFEFFSERRNRWFMIKANYTDTLVEIKYPVFELLVTDITYVKHPVGKAKAREKENACLVDRIHSCIVKVKLDEGYSIEWANDYFISQIGNRRFLQECVEPKDQKKFHCLLQNDMTCNTYSKKIRLKNRTGAVRWYDVRTEHLGGGEAMEDSIYCIFSDVTDEVAREQELKTFRKRYQMVLSITSELVFEYDVRNDTMYYFGRGENTLHRSRSIERFTEYLLGDRINGAHLTPESRSIIRNVQQRIKNNQCSMEETYISYELPNGEKQWLYVVGKYLYNDAGTIDMVIGKLSDVTGQKRTEERLLKKARTDSLTKIDNREYAKEEIIRYLLHSASGYQPSLMILDIDNFKGINDSYGHGEGDYVLIQVANILTEEFRATDIIGRLGGDEFIVFMKDIKSEEIVYEKAQKILDRIKESGIQISVSIGISMMNEQEASFEKLYKTADFALYQAKVKGKDQYVSYHELDESLKKEALAKSMPQQYGCRTDKQGIASHFRSFIDQMIQGYDFIYSINLKEDSIYRYYKTNNVYKMTEGSVYSDIYEEVLASIGSKQERQEFEGVFSREALLSICQSGRERQGFCLRMLNQMMEPEWYYIQIILSPKVEEKESCVLLVRTIKHEYIERISDYGQNKEIEEETGEQSNIDGLTGLYREQKFHYEVKKQLAQADNKKYAIIAFDVDHFRVLNDIYNETAANKVLCHMADVLRNLAVSDKIYARYCADRFMLFMSYKERREILEVVERIRTEAVMPSGIKSALKLSFGVYQIADTTVPVRLMCDWARLAEDTVKGSSMQYYAFYNEEYRNQIVERQLIENEMAGALEEKQFMMYLQPKYNLETNEVIGAEALVRWKHPVKGMVQPEKFVPLFEKNGFIIKLDEFIWEEACKQISKWRKAGVQLPISVNISRMHTYDTNFVEKLVNLVKKYDIPVHLLQLEFTESMFMEHEQALLGLMQRLKEQGFTLLMDDFGSGYSSLNMLKNIPIDIIKLDRIFFQDIMVNTRGKVIIEASIRMIHELNLEVTAEGIEKKEHIEFLNKCHCNTGQGYFYAKPMDVETFEQLCLS